MRLLKFLPLTFIADVQGFDLFAAYVAAILLAFVIVKRGALS